MNHHLPFHFLFRYWLIYAFPSIPRSLPHTRTISTVSVYTKMYDPMCKCMILDAHRFRNCRSGFCRSSSNLKLFFRRHVNHFISLGFTSLFCNIHASSVNPVLLSCKVYSTVLYVRYAQLKIASEGELSSHRVARIPNVKI
jgi:hypothetical protein